MPQELESLAYFQPPSETEPQQVAPRRRRTWTRGLTIICLLFLFIGVTGLLSAAFGIASLFEDPTEAVASANAGDKYERQAARIEQQMAETQKQYMPVLAYMEIMKFILASGFIAAAILIAQQNKRGRMLAVLLCGFAIFYHVCSAGVVCFITGSAGSQINAMMTTMIDDAAYEHGLSSAEKDQARNELTGMMSAIIAIGLTVTVVLKAAFYGLILFYLSQAHIKPIFGEDAYAGYRPKGQPAMPRTV